MVTGLPEIVVPSHVFEECVVGKQHRSEFPKSKSLRAKEVLRLVHSDICGKITPIRMEEKCILLPLLMIIPEDFGVYFPRKVGGF